MILQAEPLRRVVGRIFATMGCSDEEAAGVAWRLVNANLTGHDSHGVIRVPRYAQWMEAGTLVADQRIRVLSETAVLAVVDGCHGFGQTIGPQAVQLGVEKSRHGGVAMVALRNAGHLGRIGDWAEMAADAGLMSIHMVNVAGSRLVAPFGAIDRRMSTDPVAIGVPLDGAPHLILDFATSVVAEGKALVAARGGKPLPPGALVDGDGSLTSDPLVLYGDSAAEGRYRPSEGPGALRAMGEHKGSGLAFMCEILAGALTGSGCAGHAHVEVEGEHLVFEGVVGCHQHLVAGKGRDARIHQCEPFGEAAEDEGVADGASPRERPFAQGRRIARYEAGGKWVQIGEAVAVGVELLVGDQAVAVGVQGRRVARHVDAVVDQFWVSRFQPAIWLPVKSWNIAPKARCTASVASMSNDACSSPWSMPLAR